MIKATPPPVLCVGVMCFGAWALDCRQWVGSIRSMNIRAMHAWIRYDQCAQLEPFGRYEKQMTDVKR